MIRARIMATAMLFHNKELLMMERSPTRTLHPGMWAVVGGHVEPDEISSPRNACLREIHEETGLQEDDIIDLKLQYILLRLNEQEVRQQFIYTAQTTRKDVLQTEEGDLYWIPRDQVLKREIPFIFHCLLEHYFLHGPTDHIWVGTAGFNQQSVPEVHWTALVDPQMK